MLVGTQLGRIYYLDIQNKNQKMKYGEPECGNEVIALYANNQQKFSSVSQNGKVLIQDINNIFDQKETVLNKKIEVACFKQQDELFYGNIDQEVLYRNTNNEKCQPLLNLNTKKINDINYQDSKLGLSCKELNFTLFDVQKKQIFWKAKNFKRDELNLKAPVDNQQSHHYNNCYYVLSAFDKVYVYDIRAQRKQIQEINCQLGEDYYTNKFELFQDGNLFAVSNLIGHLNLIDFRKPKFIQKRFKEHYGSITDMKIHEDLLVSCSLDRHVNIIDLKEQKLKKRIFLSIKLSKIFIQNIQNDFEEENDHKNEQLEAKEKIFQKTLESEEALWHNNVALPYQKKLKQNNQKFNIFISIIKK